MISPVQSLQHLTHQLVLLAHTNQIYNSRHFTTSGKSIHKQATGLEHILKTDTCMQTLYACAQQNEEHLTNY